MPPHVQPIVVVPGTIIVLHDVMFDEDLLEDEKGLAALTEAIAAACGHQQFAVLRLYGDDRIEATTLPDILAQLHPTNDQEATDEADDTSADPDDVPAGEPHP